MTSDNNASVNSVPGMINNAQLDPTMNLSELLKNTKPQATEAEPAPTLEVGTKVSDKPGLSVNDSPISMSVPSNPVNPEKGIVITNSEMEAGRNDKQLKQNGADEREAAFNGAMSEMDGIINAAKQVNVMKPTNPVQMAAIVDALSDISSGSVMDESTKQVVETMISTKGATQEEIEKNLEIQRAHDELVNVVIDKTGFGANFDFTEEEKEKIRTSNLIKVTEVQNLELSTMVFTKPEKSFMETVNTYQLSTMKTPVVFPASRFRASMMGLSFGELADIALNPENITRDQLNKKLSVIYNKVVNVNTGKFTSFDEFLSKLAFTDIDMCTFGLAVSTFPEVDSVTLTCNAKNCGKTFEHKYSPRTLLRVNECSDSFLRAIKLVSETNDIAGMKANVVNSPVNTYKSFKLPYSGFLIEVGIASAYDYLNNIVDKMLDDTFMTSHPDDVNGVLALMSTFLTFVRSVSIPDGPVYRKWDKAEDIMHALYCMLPEDMAILSKIIATYNDAYQPKFAFVDIVCPHCGAKTKQIAIDVNTLVFRKYQTLEATEIVLENILDL